ANILPDRGYYKIVEERAIVEMCDDDFEAFKGQSYSIRLGENGEKLTDGKISSTGCAYYEFPACYNSLPDQAIVKIGGKEYALSKQNEGGSAGDCQTGEPGEPEPIDFPSYDEVVAGVIATAEEDAALYIEYIVGTYGLLEHIIYNYRLGLDQAKEDLGLWQGNWDGRVNYTRLYEYTEGLQEGRQMGSQVGFTPGRLKGQSEGQALGARIAGER